MNKNMHFAWLFLLPLVAGCNSGWVKPITAGDRVAVSQSLAVDVSVVKSPLPWVVRPAAKSDDKSLIGRATESSTVPDGGTMVAQWELGDPARKVAEQLMGRLQKPGRIPTMILRDDPAPVSFRGAVTAYQSWTTQDYVFEVSVPGWQFFSTVLNWREYDFSMDCVVRLVRLKDNAVIWQGHGNVNASQDRRLSLHVSDLQDTSGEKAKSAYLTAISLCVSHLEAQYVSDVKK